jgi:hypothetical protein
MVDQPVLPSTSKNAIDKLRQWSEQQISGPSRRLYHYTNAAGLIGIIKSQEIWFTEYRHLNDPTELTYGIKIAKQVLATAGANGAIARKFCAVTTGLLEPEYMTCFDAFVSSFSRKKDDLGLWRAYADDGCGFALGLTPHCIDTIKPDPKHKYFGNIFRGAVVYGERELRGLHAKAIKKAISLISAVAGVLAGSTRDVFLQEMAYQLMASIFWNCLTSKHEGYKDENEVRMIIFGKTKSLADHVETRSQSNNMVPFMRTKVMVQKRGNIAEIVVGPSAPNRAEDALKAALRLFDPDDRIQISRSCIPYNPRSRPKSHSL